MKFKKPLEIAFLVVGLLTILEFIFLKGLFTWLIVVAASIIVGTLNVVLNLRQKEWTLAGLYAICTVALCMGYFELL